MTGDYEIRAYADDDEPKVLQLLSHTMGGGPTGQRSVEFFRWKHQQNPFGPSLALLAEHEGEIVGFRTFLRWRFLGEGQRLEAVRPVDTATHPDHQGRGIFSRLTSAAVDLAAQSSALVFNTPNTASMPGYLKLGWRTVGRVPLSIRPVRPVAFVTGVRSVTRGEPLGPPPRSPLPLAREVLGDEDGLATLLAEAGADARLATDRSPEYLRWRYAEAPDLDYRGVEIRNGGEVIGVAIGRPRRRGPLAEFTLSEVLVRKGDRRTATRLLRAVAGSGCDHVTAHLTPGTVLPFAGLGAGYLRAPRQGIALVARPLGDVRPDPAQLESWRLSLGDLEVF